MATTNKSGRLKPGSIKIDVHNFELGGDTGNAHPGGSLVRYLICVAIKTNIHVANFAIKIEYADELVRLLCRQNSLNVVRFTSTQQEEYAISWTTGCRLRFIFKGTEETLTNVLTITNESAKVLLRKLNTALSSDNFIPCETKFSIDFRECPDCHGKKSILLLNSYVPCDCIKGK